MSNRHYYELEETKTIKRKGWIEVDNDFTQVYSCFKTISKDINSPTTWKLLFWLLSEKVNEKNGFAVTKQTFLDFNKYLTETCPKCPISRTTFQNSIKELQKCQVINKVGAGHYYCSPLMFWKDAKKERLDFIQAQREDAKFLENKEKDKLLLSPEYSEYEEVK